MASSEPLKPSRKPSQEQPKDVRSRHRRGAEERKAPASALEEPAHRGWRLMPDFACKLGFAAALPPPPTGPFLEDLPVDLRALVAYRTTTLETSYKWELHAGADVGVRLDIVDPMAYERARDTPMAPADQEILAYVKGGKAMKGSQAHVSWLVKGMHTHNNLFQNVHKFKDQDGNQRGDFDVSSKAKAEKVERPHDLGFIRKSFSAAQQPPQHPDQPDMDVVSEMPFFPDEEHWATVFQDVVVDDDPADFLTDSEDADPAAPDAKRQRLANAVLMNAKSVEAKFGRGHFYGDLFVPIAVPELGEAADYQHLRDYVFSISTYDVPKYVCVLDDDAREAYYCELPTKINFMKGRGARGATEATIAAREPNEKERIRKRGREAMLRIDDRDWREDEREAQALEELEARELLEERRNTVKGAGVAMGTVTASGNQAAVSKLFSREGDEDEDDDEDGGSGEDEDADDRGSVAAATSAKAAGKLNGASGASEDDDEEAGDAGDADDAGDDEEAENMAATGSAAAGGEAEASEAMDDEQESTF